MNIIKLSLCVSFIGNINVVSMINVVIGIIYAYVIIVILVATIVVIIISYSYQMR